MENFTLAQCKIAVSEANIKLKTDAEAVDVLNSKSYKIYIVRNEQDFLYVGKTKQRIATKLSQGLRSHRKNKAGKREAGYGGYKWIEPYIDKGEELYLYVIDLGENATDLQAEAIEAEIAFKIRKDYNRWPECQNEIHFNNEHPEAEGMAISILEELQKIKK